MSGHFEVKSTTTKLMKPTLPILGLLNPFHTSLSFVTFVNGRQQYECQYCFILIMQNILQNVKLESGENRHG